MLSMHKITLLIQKLGHNRTLIVNSRMLDINGPKDANDALLRGMDI